MSNEETIRRFYDAFAKLDADTMAACYAPDATFDDEAFSLRGTRAIGGMWRMLCAGTRAKGASVWKLSYRDVKADASGGSAHWDAHYLFSATGRIVDNAIDSRFSFTPEGPATPVTATDTCARDCATAPAAIARATGSLTAPCAAISAASTPSSSVFASFE